MKNKNGNTKMGQILQDKADDIKDKKLVDRLIKASTKRVPERERRKLLKELINTDNQ